MDSSLYKISEEDTGKINIRFKERMDLKTSALILKQLPSVIKHKSPSILIVNIDDVTYFDDFGILVLIELKNIMDARSKDFKVVAGTSRAKEFLSMIDFEAIAKCLPVEKKRSDNILIRLGDATITHAYNIRFLVSFVGSVFLAFLHVFFHPRSLRFNDTITYMEKTGVNAIPIVALISFLLGLVMAFMSSLQLKQFGANIYVASLVALAMVSELGPIMTAIIVAGRSGSAFAAEIGTMKISEEIDALVTMGFDPALFLAVPRIIASMIVVPILTFFFNIFAIAGGLVVGVFMLDLTMGSYIKKTIETLTLFEISWGMMKSLVFAILIAWIGCLRGFQAKGGADSVGNAATSAVVSSIFLIILFDSFCAVVRSFFW